MATVSVLCTRVRMEEKRIIAALAAAGVPALPLDPTRLPLPVGPVPAGPSAGIADGVAAGVLLDRCQNRAVAAAVLPALRSAGAVILDAGLAATGDRLAVASALAAAGIPRAVTRLVCSEESALAALDEVGYPATLLPLAPGAREIAVVDRDVAEAILEHRHVLGANQDIVALVQAGMPTPAERGTVLVVDGHAVGTTFLERPAAYPARLSGIAATAASALKASLAGIEFVLTPAGPLVWDVKPAPDFRDAMPLGRRSVAEAIADLAASLLGDEASLPAVRVEIDASLRREVTDDVALSA